MSLNQMLHHTDYVMSSPWGRDSCMRHLLDIPPHRVSQRRPLHHVLVQYSSAVAALPHVDTATAHEITRDDSVIHRTAVSRGFLTPHVLA